MPTILRHLSVLETAQLIETEKSGRIRMCRARPETMQATMDWMTDQKALWEARTDRLQALLASLQEKESDDADKPGP